VRKTADAYGVLTDPYGPLIYAFVARLGNVATRVIILCALLAFVAGCGGSGGSNGSSQGSSAGGNLVTKVEHASATVEGKSVVGTVKVTEGGKPGEHLTLRWGLVDAVSGVRASESERLAAKYTTTTSVDSHDVTIRFARPTPTDYLIHFALYGPGGTYLASSDSDVFTVQ
jgi:hypothetical protein